MTLPLRRLSFCAALFLQGCISCLFPTASTPPSVCSGGFGGFGGGPFGPAEEVRGAGQPVVATLTLESTVTCSDSAPATVTSVAVELSDPDNRPVEAAVSAPKKRQGQYGTEAWDVTIAFTPDRPGPYHVIATFEPGAGLVQRDLWVANDRRAEPPAETFTLPAPCAHLERTAQGGAVCEHATNGGQVFFRAGAEVASWSWGNTHVAGDAIWVSDLGSGLARSLDTGSGPPVLSGRLSGLPTRERFAATELDALVFGGGRLRLVRFDGGTFATESDVQLDIFEPVALAFSHQAGSAVVADYDGWTRLDLPAGQSAPAVSWTEDQAAVHQAPDGIWVASDAATLRFIPADKSQPVATLVAPLGWQRSLDGSLSLRPGERPVLFPVTVRLASDGYSEVRTIDRSTALVPTVRGAQVELSAFQAPDGGAILEVTQGQLRATRGNENFLWPLPP